MYINIYTYENVLHTSIGSSEVIYNIYIYTYEMCDIKVLIQMR
jgi:hypothetical protein